MKIIVEKYVQTIFNILESGEYAGLVFNAFDLNRRGKVSYEV